ncbi:MAG: EamA family transporter [Pseudanabaena sp. ELA607]|jgi:drug/metabolite transporter (DMT)-like permease
MSSSHGQSTSYEQTLAGITKDLTDLRANVLAKLSREILILQAQKSSLTDEIQRLQSQRKEIEVQLVAQHGLDRQEVQRQQWIEQLAQSIAFYLRNDVTDDHGKALGQHANSFDTQMMQLDNLLRATFQSLQQDMGAYQKDLNEQMQRMYSQRQQGELMLSGLVEKIEEYLRHNPPDGNYLQGDNNLDQGTGPVLPHKVTPNNWSNQGGGMANGAGFPKANGNGSYGSVQMPPFPPPYGQTNTQGVTQPLTQPLTQPMADNTAPAAPVKQLNDWWVGFIMVIGASVVLSFQNVLVRVVFVKSNILGAFQFGGLLQSSVANSFVVLLLRMLFATPVMWLVAGSVFRVNVAKDISGLLVPGQMGLFWRVTLSAALQFASFTFTYLAISLMKPAIATTVFFIFPTVTVLMVWFLFGEKPSLHRWLVIGLVYVGVILTSAVFSRVGPTPPNPLGIIYALMAGTTFAGYIVTSQACFKKLNPVSFTAINFTIILVLCIFTLPSIWGVISWQGNLLLMCAMIAATTLSGYLLTSFGTKMMGAAQASIVSSSGPVFTAFLAFSILGDKLEPLQVFGVFLVTLGVGLLSLQNMMGKKKAKA